MSASITILGINNEKHEPIILKQIIDEYLISFEEDGKKNDLLIVFELSIKKYCFEISEMLEYFNLDFKWEGDGKLEILENYFVINKKILIDLIDWYIALCYVFDDSEEILSKPQSYIDIAFYIKNNYSREYEYFTFSYYTFIELKEKISNSTYNNFLWIYSI